MHQKKNQKAKQTNKQQQKKNRSYKNMKALYASILLKTGSAVLNWDRQVDPVTKPLHMFYGKIKANFTLCNIFFPI